MYHIGYVPVKLHTGGVGDANSLQCSCSPCASGDNSRTLAKGEGSVSNYRVVSIPDCIKQGTQVMLMVTSDVEDEVHVHAYDLSAEVAPDQPAHISFRADLAGEFEVELEERTVPIAELSVTP